MTARTRIKVCGITELEGARGAVAAGVDALGFIFAEKSPRRVEPEMAREIIRNLPPFVDAVGVFVNEAFDVVNDIIQYCGLTLVQLHGAESPHYCENVNGRVIKTFGIGPGAPPPDYEPYRRTAVGYLLDTYHDQQAGGTGKTFDWGVLAKYPPPGPLILAGGLAPENVGEAIAVARPYAVDVNSGVESEPGRKDLTRLASFIEVVRRADQELSS